MQISDLLNTYSQNLTQSTDGTGTVKSANQLVSTLQQLSPGSIFEGSINELKDGVVTLGLSNGQTITARLDQGVELQKGMSMFFQVKSNQENQIAIRPYNQGLAGNVILENALDAAKLTATARNLEMVNTMMKESMAIDRQSLLNMARMTAGISENDISTAVTLQKLNLPVTQSNVEQFQNYVQDKNTVFHQLNELMQDISGQLTSGMTDTAQASQFYENLTAVLAGDLENLPGLTGENETLSALAEAASQNNVLSGEAMDITNVKIQNGMQETLQTADSALDGKVQNSQQEILQTVETALDGKVQNNQQEMSQPAGMAENISENASENAAGNTAIDQISASGLSKSELNEITNQLIQIADPSTAEALKQNGINPELSARELLAQISKLIAGESAGSGKAKELLTGKALQSLVKNAMEEQWMVKPEDLKSEHKLKDLYQRMDKQMQQIENLAKAAGSVGKDLAATAANIRSNIEFMNQVNQLYTYVQIPLKLQGQNAGGELYVYTDKKNLQDPDRELSAFLHLDLEHLGSTDVSVKMLHKEVNTKFYLEDDLSYDLVAEHMGILMERLEQKGFHTTVSVENQKKEVNFVDDFLKKDIPAKNGVVHRYSFDVRA